MVFVSICELPQTIYNDEEDFLPYFLPMGRYTFIHFISLGGEDRGEGELHIPYFENNFQIPPSPFSKGG